MPANSTSSASEPASHSAPTAFELEDVAVRYDGHIALSGLSLEIRRGEILAFVGPSGAGKTTALGLLNGTVLATSGRVRIEGRELSGLDERQMRALRSRIGVIPQNLGLVPTLRVAQNVLAGRVGREGFLGSLRRLIRPPHSELEEVHAILERLGIGGKLFQRTDTLSGGERQRVAIARSLFQEARSLVADEPLSALDPARSREILTLLLEVAAEHGLTLVLSMHALDLARELVPRLVGLKGGHLLFDLPASEVPESLFEELYELS